ncbi:hypothetical protein THAOC_25644, partial [Thalassiosira oceanica]
EFVPEGLDLTLEPGQERGYRVVARLEEDLGLRVMREPLVTEHKEVRDLKVPPGD